MCDLHSILVPRATRFKTTWPRNDELWGQECLHSISFFWACVTLVQRTKVMPSTIQPRSRVLFCRRHIGKGEDPGDEVDHCTMDEWNAQDAIWSRLFVPSITRYLATSAFWVKLTAKHSVGARAFWFSIRSLNLLCTPKSFVIRSIGHNHSLLIKASSSETITIKVLEKRLISCTCLKTVERIDHFSWKNLQLFVLGCLSGEIGCVLTVIIHQWETFCHVFSY